MKWTHQKITVTSIDKLQQLKAEYFGREIGYISLAFRNQAIGDG